MCTEQIVINWDKIDCEIDVAKDQLRNREVTMDLKSVGW